jgi:hypothetical protein
MKKKILHLVLTVRKNILTYFISIGLESPESNGIVSTKQMRKIDPGRLNGLNKLVEQSLRV